MKTIDLIFMGMYFVILSITVLTSNNSQTKLMQKWDTCVSQQKVEGAPYESFMRECMD